MVNRQHFTTLIEPHMESLYRQAWRLCGNTADAEDLLQDLLIKLYPRLDEMTAIDKLRPWMARVLYRQFIDLKRSQNRSPIHLAVDNSADSDADQPLDELISHHSGPEQRLTQDHQQQRLITAIDQLNEEQRLVLTLHDVEGYTLPELSEILDCPLGTLKSRLHRARDKVKKVLRTED